MDKEVLRLCDAMNGCKGIETICSCCGHGREPFRIWFRVTEPAGLFFFARCADRRYWRFGPNWRITVDVGDRTDILPVDYLLESVNEHGEAAYLQAADLVRSMREHYNNDAFIAAYGLRREDINLDHAGHYDG